MVTSDDLKLWTHWGWRETPSSKWDRSEPAGKVRMEDLKADRREGQTVNTLIMVLLQGVYQVTNTFFKERRAGWLRQRLERCTDFPSQNSSVTRLSAMLKMGVSVMVGVTGGEWVDVDAIIGKILICKAYRLLIKNFEEFLYFLINILKI